MPGETHFFDDIYSRQRELGPIEDQRTQRRIIDRLSTLYERYYEPADQQRVDCLLRCAGTREELTAQYSSYCEVLSRFMEIQMRYEKKVRWGNNAPRDIFNMSDIVTCYPKVKVIVCVRDVRDFLVSYKNKWKITSDEHKERLRALYHPIVTALLWKSSMRQIPLARTKVQANNLMTMRYEDLVTNSESSVRKMCAFVGEEFEPGMLNVDTHNSSVQVDSTGIFSSSIGTWCAALSNDETAVAQWLNQKELQSNGYRLAHIKGNPLHLISMFLSSPFAACRALYANKAMTGSWILYLQRRLASFLPRFRVF
jgi:hypothetical protein